MSVDPGVLDTNVLVYAVDADAPQHRASRVLLDAALDPSITLYVTSQILCEFYSLVTNPRRVRVASSATEAMRIISAMLALPGLFVLPVPARAVAAWMQLLQRHPVTGGDVFDLQIVATMQANGIQRITLSILTTLGCFRNLQFGSRETSQVSASWRKPHRSRPAESPAPNTSPDKSDRRHTPTNRPRRCYT
jgi:uncharacterized protein